MKTYSWLEITLLVNAVPIGGMGDGDDVLMLSRLQPSATHVIGVDGEMTVALSAKRAGSVKFRLNQTSESNAFMSGLMLAQENSVFVPVTVMMRNTAGKDLGGGTKGYITKPADMTRGEQPGVQEWEIVVENLQLLHGVA